MKTHRRSVLLISKLLQQQENTIKNKMDTSCTIQDNIYLSKLNIYVSRIMSTHKNHDF